MQKGFTLLELLVGTGFVRGGFILCWTTVVENLYQESRAKRRAKLCQCFASNENDQSPRRTCNPVASRKAWFIFDKGIPLIACRVEN